MKLQALTQIRNRFSAKRTPFCLNPAFTRNFRKIDRSFHWKGKRFPLCARCTGELVGGVAAALSYAVFHPGLGVLALLLVPMLIDGGVQAATRYESTNLRRLVTGVCFGYGIVCLFLLSTGYAFRFGVSLGSRLI